MAVTLTQGIEKVFDGCDHTDFDGLPCRQHSERTTYSLQLDERIGWIMFSDDCTAGARSCAASRGTHQAGADDLLNAVADLKTLGFRAMYTPDENYRSQHQATMQKGMMVTQWPNTHGPAHTGLCTLPLHLGLSVHTGLHMDLYT